MIYWVRSGDVGPIKPRQKTPAQKAEHARCFEANIRTRKIGRRGEMNRRILVDFTMGGVEYRYHVTKGWRRKAGPSS